MKYNFVLFFACLVSIATLAQEPVSYHFNSDDGLPSDEVYFALQDSDDFIWFATNNGVSRYNGTDFENFNKEHGLPDLTIFEIFEDYKKRIWFISYSNKLAYYYEGKIHQYKYNYLLKSFTERSEGPIKYGFYIDKNETVYLSGERFGLLKIDKNGNIKKIERASINNAAEIVLVDDSVGLLQRFNNTNHKNYHYCYIHELDRGFKYDDNFDINKSQSYLGKFADGYYYIVLPSSILKVSNTGEIEHYNYGVAGSIVAMHVDNIGNLWVGLRSDGLLFFENGNLNNKPKHFFKGERTVTSVLNDNENGYWVTTYTNGVYYLPNLNIEVYCYKTGLQKEKYSALKVENGTIYGGLKSLNKVIVLNKNRSTETIKVGLVKGSCINSLELFGDEIYVGNGAGINIINLNTGKNKLVKTGSVQSLTKYKDSVFCGIPFGYGLVIDENLIYRTDGLPNNHVRKFTFRVNAIYVRDGKTYFGCPNGLWQFKDDKYHWLGDNNDLFKSRVLDIIGNQDSSKLFISTKESGILIVESDTVWNINKTNGLSSNYVTSLSLCKNVLYAGTNNGISKIEFFDTTFTIQKVNEFHGLSSSMVNDIFCDSAQVYMATNNGICTFKKNSITKNLRSPLVFIQGIRINNIDTVVRKSFILDYKKNNIVIDYRGLTYKSRGTILYKYRLIGSSSNSIETYQNSVQFTALKKGNYVFEVIAANEDGIWSEIPARIEFRIKPPFWETWWFISLVIIFIIGNITLFILYRFRVIANKNKLNADLIKIRQRALGSQMNPHFIFNSLNSIQHYILDNNIEKSQEYLSDFAKLMRKILNNSQQSTISLTQELEALKLYIGLEKVRFEEKFDYEIQVSEHIDLDSLFLPPLMLQPYVENAIWHGLMHKKGGGKLSICIKQLDNEIVCEIIDNGVGRDYTNKLKSRLSNTYQSKGTSLTNTRIKLFNMLHHTEMRVVYTDNNVPTGTKVEFYIPIVNKLS